MPGLVNYSGDDEFYSGGSLCTNLMDLGCIGSMGSHLDMYCPSYKRSRVTGPFVFEQKKQQSIEILPDECLFEIFRCIPGDKDRSSCACVSKRWLMLLSSVSKAETWKSKNTAVQNVDECMKLDKNYISPGSNDIEMTLHDENGELESLNDGHLTRCLEGKKATDIGLAAIAVGTRSHGGLGKLSIRGGNSVNGVTNIGLSAIANGCPSLRVLCLWNNSYVGDEGLFAIAKECQLLEKLDLCQCPSISNKAIIAIAENCPNLTVLNIESCTQIDNECLHAIARFCPKLQSISIKDCPLVGDDGVSSLFSSAAAVFTKVKLQALNITDVSLAVIGYYGKTITNLILSGLQNVSEKGFWVMGSTKGLQKLKSLTISACGGITDVSLEAMGKGCTNLKQMCIRKCWFISDNGVLAFAKAAGSLESLQLEECNRFTQSGIIGTLSNCGAKLKSLALVKCMGIKEMASGIHLSSPCKALRSLSVRNCPGFGNTSMAIVAKLCPQLQYVDLSGLFGITDYGLIPLLENCDAGLVKVNLSGCLNLTDEAILALSRLHGGTLELLNVDGCKKITDGSLVAIADNCLLLNDLDVSNCAITDSGIAILSCAEQLNIQVLALSGCSEVSNKSIPFLKKLGKSLLGLNLQNCNAISSIVVERIVGCLWRCDIIY